MFDTHCHLQFSAFEGKVDTVIKEATTAGVDYIVVPGTDIDTSQKALEIAAQYKNVYAAVGIHPHHAARFKIYDLGFKNEIKKIENLMTNEKVVAVGEIGLDRHRYTKTKYESYQIDESFINLQKELFIAQLQLAQKYRKSVVIHNRETKAELLEILRNHWSSDFAGRMVFHCCEPDGELLTFAKKRHVFIGVDGDVTYRKDKQEFVKKIPFELLVLETDAPFLIPEPLRSQKLFPNKPANLVLIAKQISFLKRVGEEEIKSQTAANARQLFQPRSRLLDRGQLR